MTYLDLRKVRLRPGEEQRDEEDVALAPLELAGQRYIAVPEHVSAEVALTRTTSGMLFELRFHVRLHGPCFRCLEDAALDEDLSLREYQAENPEGDDELISPYVADGKLDLSNWARDSVVLALPDKILCRPDCAGLCPVCGKNLNREPHEHEVEQGDPRWAALSQLRESLE
jgi:DUF177 domain-containing protein